MIETAVVWALSVVIRKIEQNEGEGTTLMWRLKWQGFGLTKVCGDVIMVGSDFRERQSNHDW